MISLILGDEIAKYICPKSVFFVEHLFRRTEKVLIHLLKQTEEAS